MFMQSSGFDKKIAFAMTEKKNKEEKRVNKRNLKGQLNELNRVNSSQLDFFIKI